MRIEPKNTAPPSAWLVLALSLLPLVATAGFTVGAIVLLFNPPDPGDELPRNAWLAFMLYARMTGAVAGLGVLIGVGLIKDRTWSRPVGALTYLLAAGLIVVALGTGANDATPGTFLLGGALLLTCLVTAALIVKGR